MIRQTRKSILDSFDTDGLHPARGIATVLSLHEQQLSLLLEAYQSVISEGSDANGNSFSSHLPDLKHQLDDVTEPEFTTGFNEQILTLPDDWCSADFDLFPFGEFMSGMTPDNAMWLGEFASLP